MITYLYWGVVIALVVADVGAHLEDAVAAFVVVFLVCFAFANALFDFLVIPLATVWDGRLIFTAPQEKFFTNIKVAFFTAGFISFPVVAGQIWAFVAPGLYRHEKRLAVPLLVSSVVLFYVGMLFAYFVVFPLVFGFLTGTAPEGVAVMTDIARYLDFVLTLFFAFGLAFEVPIATILLVATGVTTPESLASKRPYIIVEEINQP